MYSFVPHENIHINPDDTNLELILLDIVSKNFLQSNTSLIIKQITDGLSNIVFCIRSSTNEKFIIKINGKNSDLIVNRHNEIHFMIYLSKFQMSPSILLTFNNGFIYRYVPGRPIGYGDEEKSYLIAKKLAEFHSVPILDKKENKNQFISKLRNFIQLLTGENEEIYQRVNPLLIPFLNEISWLDIIEDINHMEEILNNKNSKWKYISIVVCHNDAQSYNFLYDKKQENISLIDFEYCGKNMWLYDIFNYFLNYNLDHEEQANYEQSYLSRDKQMKWLQIYLAHATFLNEQYEKQMSLEEICDLGDCLRPLIHLYWSLWAFTKALLNPESMEYFDFLKYGRHRLNYYQLYKNEFFESVEKII